MGLGAIAGLGTGCSNGGSAHDGADASTAGDTDADGDTDTDSDTDTDADTDTDTDSSEDDHDGSCPDGQDCIDVTGEGDLACLQGGGVPVGAEEGCETSEDCEAHHTCYTYADGSGTVCIQDCYECQEGDAESCAEDEVCEAGVCMPKPCTEDSCPDGQICWGRYCSPEVSADAGPGEAPAGDAGCELPPLYCDINAEDCTELIQFDPTYGTGYSDFPENGETEENQYRSWLRRDLVYLIKYATAKVACLAEGWTYGNGGPLGLIDMSEENGAIPGTSIGSPGHPDGTHTDGHDIDVAYYQKDTTDNRARPICEHESGGSDASHCEEFPHLMDEWRNALFLGALYEHPDLRVVGCDGKAGGMIEQAFTILCDSGWIGAEACGVNKLAYEFVNLNNGWFYFHHHHMHVSFNGTSDSYKQSLQQPPRPDLADEFLCITPTCDSGVIDAFYASRGVSTNLPIMRAFTID